jgi:HAD superfamily hydrolase (TIGR01484 family)
MIPVASLPVADRRAVRYLLTDIDDTLTDSGKLPADSYDALWRIHEAGIKVIPVTGRPAGWCDLICRQWPVVAVIGENGAFAYYLEEDRLQIDCHPAAPEPQTNRDRLARIAREVYELVPGTRPAKDQFSRLYDIAIDFREEPPMLDLDAARSVKHHFESHGAQARISSIHVNAWFGEYNKVSMAEHFLADHFGLDIHQPDQNRQVVFCGDSPNDEPMFGAFHNSIGVANIREYAADLKIEPRYVTELSSAAGFVEAAGILLER